MKKMITIAALSAALLLTGCSGGGTSSDSGSTPAAAIAPTAESGATAAEKAEKLLAEVEFAGEMTAIESENMEFQLGFGTDGLTDYAAYICGSGAFPDEFGVFTADSAERAEEIKTALLNRIETQKETYADYTPDEMYKFDDCFVIIKENTVCYAVTADNAKAEEILV